MRMRALTLSLAATLCMPLAGSAQTVAESMEGLYGITKNFVMQTAEMLDAEMYAYRPTDEVRSTGEMLAHIANAQYAFCSAAAGETSPATENFEQTRTTKASIIEALEMGFGYCDGVYASMNAEKGARQINLFGNPNTGFGVLAFNAAHNYEHYGNLVTYMRMNGITPPSSMQ